MIQEPGAIRMLRVKLSPELQKMGSGPLWMQKEGELWLGLHSSRHYQTPQFVSEFKN